MKSKVAVIQCAGNCDNVSQKMEYQGVDTCQAVSMLYAGDSACSYGCLGHGDCVAACPEQAIKICNGLAVVDEDKCVGCGICAKTCPKHVIAILPQKFVFSMCVVSTLIKVQTQEKFVRQVVSAV